MRAPGVNIVIRGEVCHLLAVENQVCVRVDEKLGGETQASLGVDKRCEGCEIFCL